MIRLKHILQIIDAGGPESFMHFDFPKDPTFFEHNAQELAKAINDFNEANAKLQIALDKART